MASPPESTKVSPRQRLLARARERWPLLVTVRVRPHGAFAYVSGELAGGTALPLFRLRYTGSASSWGFAVYRASHDDYDNSVLPSGCPFGTPQEALDCACGLYLNDSTAWQQPPTN
jgi:choline dehydrogenase-like flavoprotein